MNFASGQSGGAPLSFYANDNTPIAGEGMAMNRDGFTTSTIKHEATAPRLLRAASELLGSNKLLAERLGISQSMLIKYMSGMSEVPVDVATRCSSILLEEPHG